MMYCPIALWINLLHAQFTIIIMIIIYGINCNIISHVTDGFTWFMYHNISGLIIHYIWCCQWIWQCTEMSVRYPGVKYIEINLQRTTVVLRLLTHKLEIFKNMHSRHIIWKTYSASMLLTTLRSWTYNVKMYRTSRIGCFTTTFLHASDNKTIS